MLLSCVVFLVNQLVVLSKHIKLLLQHHPCLPKYKMNESPFAAYYFSFRIKSTLPLIFCIQNIAPFMMAYFSHMKRIQYNWITIFLIQLDVLSNVLSILSFMFMIFSTIFWINFWELIRRDLDSLESSIKIILFHILDY